MTHTCVPGFQHVGAVSSQRNSIPECSTVKNWKGKLTAAIAYKAKIRQIRMEYFFLIHITSIINVRKKRREAKPWSGLPARYVHCCHKTAAKSSARVSETWR